MTFSRKYDRISTGVISAILIPVITGFFIWLFSARHYSAGEYITRISEAGIVTHIVSLCVFMNIVIFLVFNYFDMLRASRGVLGMTIAWAVAVFIIWFL